MGLPSEQMGLPDTDCENRAKTAFRLSRKTLDYKVFHLENAYKKHSKRQTNPFLILNSEEARFAIGGQKRGVGRIGLFS